MRIAAPTASTVGMFPPVSFYLVRRVLIFALVVGSACSHGERHASPLAPVAANGPDAILVRMPREGGTVRAYRWGTDSVLWTSNAHAPRLDHVLAFDDEQGALAYVDSRGVPGRLDLRIRSAEAAAGVPLAALASADGWAIFGLTSKRAVSRLTPSGTWTFVPERSPDVLLPLTDGSLVMITDDGSRTQLRRLHPPEPRITDSASVPRAQLVVRTEIGDRIYFIGDSGLAGVRVRDLVRTKTIKLPGSASDAVATPSGDRIFVALRGRKSIVVIDRFAEQIARSISLASDAMALRMDPDGQFMLVRHARGDSVSIVSIATSRIVGTVRSGWRSDLPLVGPEGRLALAQDNDVLIVDAETHRERTRYASGATDLWALIRWNGFRPRAAVLDEPVNFAADTESTQARAAADSTRASAVSTLPPAALATVTRPPESTAPVDPHKSNAPLKRAFTLSFAAMLSEDRANIFATGIKVDGKPVHVVPSTRDGTPVFRVVFGPFDSRDEAERVGRRSGLPFWVYEGAP